MTQTKQIPENKTEQFVATGCLATGFGHGIISTSLGGYQRRTAKLCLHSGRVTFTLGDKSETELFNFISCNTKYLSYE